MNTTAARAGAPGRDTVLGKALLILRAFTVERTTLTFAELQAQTALPRATLHRVADDLLRAGLLGRRHGRYHLSGLVFELGMRASTERGLLDAATPSLDRLRDQTRETVHLAVLEGTEVLYVAKVGGRRAVESPSRIGGRMPLHATAVGKALLAHSPAELLDRVLSTPLRRLAPRTIVDAGMLRAQLGVARAKAIAYEYEESGVGVACVAAPVFDADRSVVAAISVTGPVPGFTPPLHASSVGAAAAAVTAAISRRGTLGAG
ncbi:IclR family transcriptional regulator [Actinoplanes sp. RD1]|uniref:IclR family transcriptional regulator n=1 Tax=Actinoplanes sp. RD1 TaxID=3064538 RepID=UPI002740ED3D|nr:IclR family transcriptional regulator [Actinoplanes sp. RD1]